MPQRRWIAALTALLATSLVAQDLEGETRFLQSPAISKNQIAFVYAGDLWIVPKKGGLARRLTSHIGDETRPHFSPDGKRIAFSAEYEGNVDVYTISVDGGMPRRLTWHPSADYASGFAADGRVLFTSARLSGPPVLRAYLVEDVENPAGLPEPLPMPKVAWVAASPDGKSIAYTPIPDAFRSWKRYRGGRTTPIWIFDLKTQEVEQVPHENATDTFPCWVGGTLYFCSDRDGSMQLYSYVPGSQKVEKKSAFTDFDIRNLGSGGGSLVIEQGFTLHVFNPKAGKFDRLKIEVPNDGLFSQPRWRAAGDVRSGEIAPSGRRAVFELRGEIATIAKERGDPRLLYPSPGAHDRSPTWSPDGASIAWLSDRSGEYQLLVGDALGRQEPRAFDLGGAGFYYAPKFSPDGKRVALFDKSGQLVAVTLDSAGTVTPIAKNVGNLGVPWVEYEWSPDSRHMAIKLNRPETRYGRIALYSFDQDSLHFVTDGFADADNPTFSADGRLLYFAASVDSGQGMFGLDMSASTARPGNSAIYVAVLDPTMPHPFWKEGDEGSIAKKDQDKAAEKKKKAKVEADSGAVFVPGLDGLDQRILALPLVEGSYTGLQGGDGCLYYLDGSGKDRSLKKLNLGEKKPETLADGVSSYSLSADRKTFLLNTSGGWRFADGGKPGAAVSFGDLTLRIEPEAEWRQILREVWRIQRDYFYDKNLHGVDWPAQWERYSALLPHVRHRDDLNVLIAEMIGELSCGHEYVSGGDAPSAPKGPGVGLLGADIAVDQGFFRIAKIYRGQNWDPRRRAPLTGPGVQAAEGDFILAINGRKLTAAENFYARFEGLAGREVELSLSVHPDSTAIRTVLVYPLGDETELRRQSWIEGNRARVDALSGGRLAYVYMPDTGGRGYASFNRDYYSQLDRQGLVLDERYNGGGKIADYVVEVLSRDVLCYWMTREEWLGRTPFGSLQGPKVMVVNERAGSGGDAMPWLFQKLKIGPVVGTRTWGGLVGISGYPVLMDGGSVTAASFGIMDTDGRWVVENEGVTPDVEVIEWPKAILGGADPQLDEAVRLALEALEKSPVPPRPVYTPPAKR